MNTQKDYLTVFKNYLNSISKTLIDSDLDSTNIITLINNYNNLNQRQKVLVTFLPLYSKKYWSMFINELNNKNTNSILIIKKIVTIFKTMQESFKYNDFKMDMLIKLLNKKYNIVQKFNKKGYDYQLFWEYGINEYLKFLWEFVPQYNLYCYKKGNKHV